MPTTVKFYGNTTEITTYEKEVNKKRVYVHSSRKYASTYQPRRPDNLRRTRQQCLRRVSTAIVELGAPLFCTLTFAGSASNVYAGSQSLTRFQRRLRAKYSLAQSVFIPEISPRGRLHFHGLLFGLPQSLGAIKKGGRTIFLGRERETRELATLWQEGFVDVLQTDGSLRLAGYISKYVTKNGGHPLLSGIRLLRVSHGFPKETVIKNDDYLSKRVIDSFEGILPYSEWENYSVFLGKITKKKYVNK